MHFVFLNTKFIIDQIELLIQFYTESRSKHANEVVWKLNFFLFAQVPEIEFILCDL